MPTLARATPVAYPQGAAACVGADPDVFFPPGHSERLEREAVAICQPCPLRDECLDYALAWDVRGIWGGTTYRQREQIRSAQGIAALPVLVGWIVDRRPGPKPGAKAAPPPAGTPDLDLSPEGDPMPAMSVVPEPGPESHDVEAVDELLEAARALGDRKVTVAVERAETAIARLRDVYTEAARRIADEKAAQEAKAEALAEIERLKAQLAAAEAKAAEAGVKLRKTAAKPSGGVPAKQVRAWARENGVDVPEHGRIPGDVLDKYEAAHRAVAS